MGAGLSQRSSLWPLEPGLSTAKLNCQYNRGNAGWMEAVLLPRASCTIEKNAWFD